MEKLISIEEVAELLNVPKSWIYTRTRTGKIPFIKLGKYLRFDRAEVVAWARNAKN